MIRVIKAPTQWIKEEEHEVTVFLAGSIEMGEAVDWQTQLTAKLNKAQQIYIKNDAPWIRSITVLNPRRDDWDSSWVQSIDNPQFKEQVTWELNSMERADFVYMHFDPKTKSPITLLELGIAAPMKRKKLIINCAEGFWRKGNVDIVAERYGCTVVDSFTPLHYILTH